MRDWKTPALPARTDDLRAARAFVAWPLLLLIVIGLITAIVRWGPSIDAERVPAVSGGQMILALSGCPTATGEPMVLLLQLTVDTAGIVQDASCAEVRRPRWLPRAKVM